MSQIDEVYDLVVVGSGAGAMSAALYAAAQGLQVIVLEKSSLYGGTTARSGGVMWMPNNPFLARDGIEDTPAQALQYLDNLAAEFDDAPGATPERRRAYVESAPQMLKFLLERGLKLDRISWWPDYHDELPGGLKSGRSVVADLFNVNELGEWKDRLRPGFIEVPATLEEAMAVPNFKRSWKSRAVLLKIIGRVIFSMLTRRRYISGGAALQGRMLQAALRAGVDVRTETAVQELLVENGRISGVLCMQNGAQKHLGAQRGVLVAAGGFSHNQEMRDRYQPGTSEQWSSVPVEDTGEMIEEMMRHGAAIGQMEEMVGNPCVMTPDSQFGEVQKPAQGLTAKPHAILVDQSAVRFMNEGCSYMTYCQQLLKRNSESPAIPSWAVFDSQYIEKYMLGGSMPGAKKPQSWFDEGFLKKADTIEALAAMMEVPAEQLAATVTRFNGFVDNNCDEDFHRGEREYAAWLGDPLHKPSASLGRIERGPFYAMAVYPGDVGTYGGVVTDEYARVLREDGSVIENLYATGVCTASVMGRAYAGAGSSIGPSMTFGFRAAQHLVGTAS